MTSVQRLAIVSACFLAVLNHVVKAQNAPSFNVIIQTQLSELGTFIFITSKEDKLLIKAVEVNRGKCRSDHIYEANPPGPLGDLTRMASGGGQVGDIYRFQLPGFIEPRSEMGFGEKTAYLSYCQAIEVKIITDQAQNSYEINWNNEP